ncbi:MAG: hypothetical protein ABIO04_08150 [Ferruginibacter sp.]
MLQNRVDPFGELIKTTARGSWTGTRGLIHNDQQKIIRPFRLKAWITCKLEFKERKRKVMSPGKYTELFFLDEATAFSAGHRPCCECRREMFNKFKAAWVAGNPEYNFHNKTSIREIDNIIHRERINVDGSKVTFEENINDIPDGTFISVRKQPFLFSNKQLFLWSPLGYNDGIALPNTQKLTILTPKSIINAFHAGYSFDQKT